MNVLALIIYGSDVALVLVLFCTPIVFFRLLPGIRRRWPEFSGIRRFYVFAFSIVSGGCAIGFAIVACGCVSYLWAEGAYKTKSSVEDRLITVEGLLLMYRLDFDEVPQGSAKDIWQAVLEKDELRSRWERTEDKYLKTDRDGNLVDGWGSAVRFRKETKYTVMVYSAGIDECFGTDDDIPKKWEPQE